METLLVTKVIRVGTSLAVVIPKKIRVPLKIERGDYLVAAVYQDGAFVLGKPNAEAIKNLKPPTLSYD